MNELGAFLTFFLSFGPSEPIDGGPAASLMMFRVLSGVGLGTEFEEGERADLCASADAVIVERAEAKSQRMKHQGQDLQVFICLHWNSKKVGPWEFSSTTALITIETVPNYGLAKG
jgi:hypothetical protein